MESVPVLSREVALVPSYFCGRVSGSDTRKVPPPPLSLGALTEIKSSVASFKPSPSPMWAQNPLSSRVVLPFAAPSDEQKRREEAPEWRVESARAEQQHRQRQSSRRQTPNSGVEFRHRSPIHNVHDGIDAVHQARATHERAFLSLSARSDVFLQDELAQKEEEKKVPLHGHSATEEWSVFEFDDGTYASAIAPAVPRPIPVEVQRQQKQRQQVTHGRRRTTATATTTTPLTSASLAQAARMATTTITDSNGGDGGEVLLVTPTCSQTKLYMLQKPDAEQQQQQQQQQQNMQLLRQASNTPVLSPAHASPKRQLKNLPKQSMAAATTRTIKQQQPEADLLCVSKETCGSKQRFLYKLGDLGRN